MQNVPLYECLNTGIKNITVDLKVKESLLF